jgi:hypothetical protein
MIVARARPPVRARRKLAAVATIALALALAAAACASPATPSPAGSVAPSAPSSVPPSVAPSTAGPIATAEAAAAAVVASDPRFAAVSPRNPDLIGQCCFSTVTATDSGWQVDIEIGWGDCPAGCIDNHQWTYAVARDGTIELLAEAGPPVPTNPGAGGANGSATTEPGPPGIRGLATAGPVCPVAKPNDPACADRPVAGATIHIFDERGLEVAQLETDAGGAFLVSLEPGVYRVVADPVEGLMRTPEPLEVTVGAAMSVVTLTFDTGIR